MTTAAPRNPAVSGMPIYVTIDSLDATFVQHALRLLERTEREHAEHMEAAGDHESAGYIEIRSRRYGRAVAAFEAAFEAHEAELGMAPRGGIEQYQDEDR